VLTKEFSEKSCCSPHWCCGASILMAAGWWARCGATRRECAIRTDEILRPASVVRCSRSNKLYIFVMQIDAIPSIEGGAAYGIFNPLSVWLYKNTYRNSRRIKYLPFLPAIEHQFGILIPAHRIASRQADQFIQHLKMEMQGILSQLEAEGLLFE